MKQDSSEMRIFSRFQLKIPEIAYIIMKAKGVERIYGYTKRRC